MLSRYHDQYGTLTLATGANGDVAFSAERICENIACWISSPGACTWTITFNGVQISTGAILAGQPPVKIIVEPGMMPTGIWPLSVNILNTDAVVTNVYTIHWGALIRNANQ